MSPANSPLIDVTQFGGVAQLRFNRPEALNALNDSFTTLSAEPDFAVALQSFFSTRGNSR